MNKKCIYCEEKLQGRSDRKFCSDQCRALYHNKNKKEKEKAVIHINQVLKKNRNILKKLNPVGKTTIPKHFLDLQGFDFRFYTHIYKTKNSTYFFCYEYGYMPLPNENKVVIINWQDYMKTNLPDSFKLMPIS